MRKAIILPPNARKLPQRYRRRQKAKKAAKSNWEPAGEFARYDEWGLAVKTLRERGLDY